MFQRAQRAEGDPLWYQRHLLAAAASSNHQRAASPPHMSLQLQCTVESIGRHTVKRGEAAEGLGKPLRGAAGA